MDEALLAHYERERAYLRRLAGEFRAGHGAAADRLKLGEAGTDDPHVARLLDGFALLAARLRLKLDDDLPEITEPLLELLAPHYLAPLPATLVVQFRPRPGMAGTATLPAGTELETGPVGTEAASYPCVFATTAPTTLQPLSVDTAVLADRVDGAPDGLPRGAALLHLGLAGASPDVDLRRLSLGSLRLFLADPLAAAGALYEVLLNRTLAVAAVVPGRAPVLLPPGCLRPGRMGEAESLLPPVPGRFPGHRLLSEFAAAPRTFLFVDLDGLPGALAGPAPVGRVDLYLVLSVPAGPLARAVRPASLALNCAAAANLFRLRAEPIRLDHRAREYLVSPDMRRAAATEVHCVTAVEASTPAGDVVPLRPLFAPGPPAAPRGRPLHWLARRRPAPAPDPAQATGPGRETHVLQDTWLSVLDPGLDPFAEPHWELSVHTVCGNGDLPNRLPPIPSLRLVEPDPAVAGVEARAPVTRTLRPPLREGHAWRLVSHLSTGRLPLDGPEGGAVLREALRLYDFGGQAAAALDGASAANAVRSAACRRGATRVPGPHGPCLANGLDVELVLDGPASPGGPYLTAQVLERYLGHHATINAFVRLTARVEGQPEVLKRWPARAGDRLLA